MQNTSEKLKIMQISKKLLKIFIKDLHLLIRSYNEDSEKFPQVKYHNDKQILKMEGKIEAYQNLINHF